MVTGSVVLEVGATGAAAALALRPWCLDDVAALVEVYRDLAMVRWTTSRLDSEGAGVRWVEAQREGWAAGERFAFAVLDSGSGELVGNVVLKEVAAGKGFAEVGYWTAAAARGRGVASRGLEAVTGWGFEALGLERLELLHQLDNVASCRVAEKVGYGFERTLSASPPEYPLDGHLHVRRGAA